MSSKEIPPDRDLDPAAAENQQVGNFVDESDKVNVNEISRNGGDNMETHFVNPAVHQVRDKLHNADESVKISNNDDFVKSQTTDNSQNAEESVIQISNISLMDDDNTGAEFRLPTVSRPVIIDDTPVVIQESDIDENAEDSLWNSGSETSYQNLTSFGKTIKILYFGLRIVFIFLLLYLFICSLDIMGSVFNLIGGKTAGKFFSQKLLLNNPLAGLMIGVLVTVFIQSSSSTTSIIVAMVTAQVLEGKPAIYIIMGANIGTSITNTLVAVAQAGDRVQFQRAFAGSVLHDLFNWFTCLILLPLQVLTGFLLYITSAIVSVLPLSSTKESQEFLTLISKPFTKLIIQIDKQVIHDVALGLDVNKSLVKRVCSHIKQNQTECVQNGTGWTVITKEVTVPEKYCVHIFADVFWSDLVIGILLGIIALLILGLCLYGLVKILKTLMTSRMLRIIRSTHTTQPRGRFHFLRGYLYILVGTVMTILIQSSSAFTSTLTPLVGLGVISLKRMYALTLGANLGTTSTGVLAAFTSTRDTLPIALRVSFAHVLFNVCGILIWYPVPFMRNIILNGGRYLGEKTSKYRWFAVVYLLTMFVAIPLTILGLSTISVIVCLIITILICLFVIAVWVINKLQVSRPNILPSKLVNWNFLPLWMHSLDPMDKGITKIMKLCGSLALKKKKK